MLLGYRYVFFFEFDMALMGQNPAFFVLKLNGDEKRPKVSLRNVHICCITSKGKCLYIVLPVKENI